MDLKNKTIREKQRENKKNKENIRENLIYIKK